MIRSIQLLRALAALLVVHSHIAYLFFPSKSFGGFGVDIFFVLSGFIMTMLMKQQETHFFTKRLIRVVPLYFIFTLIQYIQLNLPGHVNYNNSSFTQFISSLLFINPTPILPPGWTLNYEMFFYFLIGITILVSPRFSIYITAAIITAGIIIDHFNSLFSFLPQDYFNNNIMFEFLFGMLLFHIKNKLSYHPITAIVLAIFATGYMVYLELTYFNIIYTNNRAWLFGIPSLLLCAAILSFEKKIDRTRPVKFFLLIGDSSYAIYLSHFFVVYFFLWLVIKKLHIDTPHLGISLTVITYCIIMTVTMGTAVVIHLYVEKRMIRYLRQVFRIDKREK